MPLPGRRMIAAFLAGAIAASLLFALPLWTIRDRVQALEEDQARRSFQLEQAAGEELVQAGRTLSSLGAGPPSDRVQAAAGHVSAAHQMMNLSGPVEDRLGRTLNLTERTLDRIARGIACRLLSPGGVVVGSLPMLGNALVGAGMRMTRGDDPGATRMAGPAVTLAEGVNDRLRRHARVASAELAVSNGTANVTVRLEGFVPAPECRAGLSVQVCVTGPDGSGACRSTQGTDPQLVTVDRRTIRVPAPFPADGSEGLELTVRDEQSGIASQGTCTLAPQDGARCPSRDA